MFLHKQLIQLKTTQITHDSSTHTWRKGFVMSITLSLFIGLFSAGISAQAAMVAMQDGMPSALAPVNQNPEALARLTGNGILIYAQKSQPYTLMTQRGPRYYPATNFHTAAIILPIPPDRIRETLSHYPGYVGLFPTLTKATVLSKQANDTQVKYRIHVPVPIPLLSFNEDVTLQHHLEANSLTSLILDSPMPYGQGKFEWFPLKNGQTLVTLTEWGDLNVTKGFVISTIMKSVPEIKTGILPSVNAFVLESLRRRFSPDTQQAVQPVPQVIPVPHWQDEDMAQLQRIQDQSGSAVYFIHRPVLMSTQQQRAEKMHFVTTIDRMPAPLSVTKNALTDPVAYQKLFRQVNKVDVSPLPNNAGQDARIGIKLGLGILSIPFKLQLRYLNEGPTQIRYVATGGDIEYMVGRMTFEPLDTQSTRLIMTSSGKVGDKAPALLKIGKSLPYYELMPTIGSAPIIMEKMKRYVKGFP